MQKMYKLDEDDIRLILAEHFDCMDSDVRLEVTKETVGYGTAEHTESVISATIVFQKES